MKRLLVHVEGETEESFVNELLAPHLQRYDYSRVSARLIGNARQRHRRGGIRAWSAVRKEIVSHLKDDPESIATTMVDYYGLPQTGSKAWPGRSEASRMAFPQKGETVEVALSIDVGQAMGDGFDQRHFIPYVMVHEFEALLFSDCEGFGRGIGRTNLSTQFQRIRDEFANPEEIDDSPETAPSKRIQGIVPQYQKPLMGNLAALEIGLPSMRSACRHFDDWLKRLETAST